MSTPVDISSDGIIVDEKTSQLISAIASANTEDINKLFTLTGGDISSFRNFIADSGYEDSPDVMEILETLVATYESQPKKGVQRKRKTRSKEKNVKRTKQTSRKKPTTKAETFTYIADKTGLTKKDVSAVFESLNTLIRRDIRRTGPGMYTLPGLMKIKVVRKPATRSRKGVNPFTGEEMVFKAKPARNVVKVLPLKGLKDDIEES